MRRFGPLLLLGACALATAKLIAWLAAGEHTVQAQRGWFWMMRPGEAGMVLFALALFAMPLCIRFAALGPHRLFAARVAALIALGFALQHGLAYTDRLGIEGMRNRITKTGHGEFAITAAQHPNAIALIKHYEQFVAAPDQVFARSKPPGQLLFYMACSAAADRVMPVLWDPPMTQRTDIKSASHGRLVNFATLFFPLFSMLPIVPLAYLGNALLGRERALWPALLFLLIPQVQLVTLHMDQVIYPLLVATVYAFAVHAALARTRALVWWIATGTAAWFALFVSFSVAAALVPLVFVIPLVHGASLRDRARALGTGVAVAAVAFFAWLATFAVLLDYRVLVAYRRGFENHVRWNGWRDDWTWPAAKLNLSEFAYWLGVPIVALFLWQLVVAIRRPKEPLSLFGWATLAAILITAAVGKTLGEVARLWLVFVPAVVLLAARALAGVRAGSSIVALYIVSGTQVAWMVALKMMQDFR